VKRIAKRKKSLSAGLIIELIMDSK
jgi:hypothetical protein